MRGEWFAVSVALILLLVGTGSSGAATGPHISFLQHAPAIAKDGTPAAVLLRCSDLEPGATYDIRVAVESGGAILSQTWTGETWRYSKNRAFSCVADEAGTWEGEARVRIAVDASYYESHVSSAATAVLALSLRPAGGSYAPWYSVPVLLLDMDETTTNGTAGGLITGYAPGHASNASVRVMDQTGAVQARAVSGAISQQGFFTAAVPAGGPYSVHTDAVGESLQNITVHRFQTTTVGGFSYAPNAAEARLLITEVYYNSYAAGEADEYVRITNPTSSMLMLSGWVLTTTPMQAQDEQRPFVIPAGVQLAPNESIVMARDIDAYTTSTGRTDDVVCVRELSLRNSGAALALKNAYNHTVDVVVYGTAEYTGRGWTSEPVPAAGEGLILSRAGTKDTNASEDWHTNSRIGQSAFSLTSFAGACTVVPYVSPDSSFMALTGAIDSAETSLYIAMYEFTNMVLARHIIDALDAGNVSDVKLFLEGGPVGWNAIDDRERFIVAELVARGAEVRFLSSHEIPARYPYMHAKYLIIDNRTIALESANFGLTGIPPAHQGNREWGIIIENHAVAAYFLDVFFHDWNPACPDSHHYSPLSRRYGAPSSWFAPLYTAPERDEAVHARFPAERRTVDARITPVLSPDTSEAALCTLIAQAHVSVYVEQAHIAPYWPDGSMNPLIESLIAAAARGVAVSVLMNFNPSYEGTNDDNLETRQLLEAHDVAVRLLSTESGHFANLHNKGVIVDNETVLISSINWNYNSLHNNREAGVIVENSEIAAYFSAVFAHDWRLAAITESANEIERAEISIFITCIGIILTISTIRYIMRQF